MPDRYPIGSHVIGNVPEKHIAVYGGSFNPPTLAHLFIADSATLLENVDEVWMIPAYKHRFKGNNTVDAQRYSHILSMLGLCTAPMSNVAVKETEYTYSKLNADYDGSTYELLSYLNSLYPDYEFSIIIGQDNADDIKKWKHWEKLVNEYRFIIVDRNTGDENSDFPGMIHERICNTMYLDVSSSKARAILSTHGSFTEEMEDELNTLLPKSVIHYILHEGTMI